MDVPTAYGWDFDRVVVVSRFVTDARDVLGVTRGATEPLSNGLPDLAIGGLTWYDTSPFVVPGTDVDADASRLTMASKRQDVTTSVASLGTLYVAGLWKS